VAAQANDTTCSTALKDADHVAVGGVFARAKVKLLGFASDADATRTRSGTV